MGAFIYGLLRFIQENPLLVAEAEPPISFMPQLLPYCQGQGILREIWRAVTDASSHPGAASLFLVNITWDEPGRSLTFSAPPEAAVAVTPTVIDLSDGAIDARESKMLRPAEEEPDGYNPLAR